MYRTLLPSPDQGGFAPRPYAVRPPPAGRSTLPELPHASGRRAAQRPCTCCTSLASSLPCVIRLIGTVSCECN
jgi:hypothetical protein